jgi:30S ribosomal protein S31
MGKGDKKTRRGKLFMGSYGVRRPKAGKKKDIKPVPVKEE